VKAFIIFRDRVTYGSRCASALTLAGLDVHVVDNGTTYKPALAWLDVLEARGTPVMRKGGGHPQELWGWKPFREAVGDERYIVTDPDVVPDATCPPDWPARLEKILDEPDGGYTKAGLGLRIDDIPEWYHHRDHVLEWEGQFWANPIRDGSMYGAQLDTTLAMYEPLSEQPHFTIDGIRTGPPYVANHLAWYEDLDNLTPELQYYHENTEPGISFWTLEARSAWNR
jgi:hypothetical protein